MCYALCLTCDNLVKWNHKGFTFEYIHHFLNKSIAIVAQKRYTNDVLVVNKFNGKLLKVEESQELGDDKENSNGVGNW